MMKDILPPSQRRKAYLIFACVLFILGAIGTGFDAAGAEFPLWLDIANRVALFTGTAFGFVAGGNTPEPEPVPEPVPTALIKRVADREYVVDLEGQEINLVGYDFGDVVSFLDSDAIVEVVVVGDEALAEHLQGLGFKVE